MAVNTQAPEDTVSTDRIEKRVVLRAPRTRVWRALTNAEEFGTWFRVRLEGAFTEGKPIRGKLAIHGYEHLALEMLVERIDPERYFSYRWHPYAVDPAVDYSAEPTTLVEFMLEETDGGTALTRGGVWGGCRPAAEGVSRCGTGAGSGSRGQSGTSRRCRRKGRGRPNGCGRCATSSAREKPDDQARDEEP